MSNIVSAPNNPMAAIENVLIRGNLADLTELQRVDYYNRVCETIGLNPLTKPFDYIVLNGKLVLYANKGCAEQLRQIKALSIRITDRQTIEGVYVVTAAAQMPNGRVDEATGAVTISGLKGDMLANAMMKAETKAKRRVTLSVCGLNMLDETEVETIPRPNFFTSAQPGPNDAKATYLTASKITSGSFAGYDVKELSLRDAWKKREILENKSAKGERLTNEELQNLDQLVHHIETLQNLDPNDAEAEPTQERIKCPCSSDDLVYSSKGVYYCKHFKKPGEHIRSVPKAEYEAVQS